MILQDEGISYVKLKNTAIALHYWSKTYQITKKHLSESINTDKSVNDLKSRDLFGELYQIYSQNTLEVVNDQIRIRQKSTEDRNDGRYYTPIDVIEFILNNLQDLIQANQDKSNQTEKKVNQSLEIADIACGTGRFLTTWALQEIYNPQFSPSLFTGYDTDREALEIAQSQSLERMRWICADALLASELDRPNQFDIIIGNPPYIESRDIPDVYWNSLRNKFNCAIGKFDLSVVFLERIISLLRNEGWAGLIVSNKWLVSTYGEKIRNLLLGTARIHLIIDVSQWKIFKGIDTYPIIIIFQKVRSIVDSSTLSAHTVKILNSTGPIDLVLHNSDKSIASEMISSMISQSFFLTLPHSIITTRLTGADCKFITRFLHIPQQIGFFLQSEASPYILRDGIHTGNIKNKLIIQALSTPNKGDPSYKRLLTSRQKVNRYTIEWKNLWIQYKQQLIDKTKGDYSSLRESWIFDATPKIIIKLFGKRLQAAIDHWQYYVNNSLSVLILKLDANAGTSSLFLSSQKSSSLWGSRREEFYYLVGVLNSALINHYYRLLFHHTHVRGDYMQFYLKDLGQIPLIFPTVTNIAIMMEISWASATLEQLYYQENTPKEQITNVEEQIDNLVEKLYQIPPPSDY